MTRGTQIATLMTRAPVCADPYELLIVARDRMAAHHIRHLPVVDDGKLVGVLSTRDAETLERCPRVIVAQAIVADAMDPDVLAVPRRTPVEEVAAAMADRRRGCAVVVRADGRPCGVFTCVDALKALSALLPTHAPTRRPPPHRVVTGKAASRTRRRSTRSR